MAGHCPGILMTGHSGTNTPKIVPPRWDCLHDRRLTLLKRGCANSGGVCQERKFSPKKKFSAGHPCGHPAKNFGQALEILEKQAFRNGHPTRTSMKKLRSEKLRGSDFSFPSLELAEHGRRLGVLRVCRSSVQRHFRR